MRRCQVTEQAAQGRPNSGVQVIARAAEILRALQAEPAGLTQAELATRLDLAKSTTYRLLSALEQEGLVGTAGSRARYRLGPEIARMAAAVRRSLIGELHPLLEQLSRAVEETVDLSVLDGNHLRFIDQVVADQRLRAVSAVGDTFPLHCTANGKAVLASLSPLAVDRLLPQRLVPNTPKTLVTRKQLNNELANIRETGVAFDREEHTEGICAIGVSLGEVAGEVAVISVPMPAARFYGREDQRVEIIQAVLAERPPQGC